MTVKLSEFILIRIVATAIATNQGCGVGLKNPIPTPCILKNYDSDSSNFSEVRLPTPNSDYQKHSVINSKVCTHRFFYLSVLSTYMIYKWQVGNPGLQILEADI